MRTTSPTRHPRSRLLVAIAVLALLAGTMTAAIADPADTISIIKDGEEGLSTAEIASRLTDATFASAERVLIGRDDEFADAMTSGLLQSESPLLLVPSAGPIPPEIMTQIELLDPAEVLLLGGVDAISAGVEAELTGEGYAVDRTFGPSRIETATAIADVGAQGSETVLIARAFSDPTVGDPTQAFADAMAAGGWSASSGWPILLTETEVLTGTTRNYLSSGAVRNAFILGGTAAVSAEVEAELRLLVDNVERVAGSDRFGTAVAVAEKVGAPTASDAARLTLVDGQGDNAWAGGFAAAAHSARFGAPIVLTSGEVIPPATAAWLSSAQTPEARRGSVGDTPNDTDPIRLTCVTVASVCDEARSLLELPPRVLLRFDPPSGSTITQGDGVEILANNTVDELQISGSCTDGPIAGPSPTDVTITTVGECELIVTPILPGGVAQDATTASYTVIPPEDPVPQVVFHAGEEATDQTTGELRLVGVDGSNPRVIDACDGCRDLRVSADGQTLVYVHDDQIITRTGQDFATPTTLVPLADAVSWSEPQFTPDGQAVIATRNNNGDIGVERITLADGTITPLAPGHRVAGSDAVGAADGAASGAGVLVYVIESVQPGVQSNLGLVDIAGGPVMPLVTVPGVLQSAALSPDGTAYAYDRGGDPQVSVGFFEQRPTLDTDLGADLRIGQLVWADDSTVQGLDYNPPPLKAAGLATTAQVDVTVGAQDLTVDEGPRRQTLIDVGRPGPSGGSLIAQIGTDLAFADTGVTITDVTGTQVTNPHVLPVP
ncbi:cell wall-binding repeat-containing protein [Euzebya tangerina]|uniref:cell wall-binding repeat-containing protein n=1 Tax=Euzebya tangerina TaxID=591198 RepID=UPI000E3175E1|nr:cell wall-binding repeat-containing protein [Euzebya tangerina]